ncbi:hypothetical protein [Microbacterium sp. LjRoot45]|uniref:hypothetical protein n=1 Tax=Microbacterium sp. LjRoot45 TaxID=3342329 RepID=UPI003F504ED9
MTGHNGPITPLSLSTQKGVDAVLPRRAPLAHALVQRAARVIDRSGVVDLLDQWDREDGRRSRRSVLSHRTVLIGWITVALEGRGPTVAGLHAGFFQRLTPASRTFLQLPEDFVSDYATVARAVGRVLRAIGPSPMFTAPRAGVIAAANEDPTRSDEGAVTRARAAQVANRLIGAHIDGFLPVVSPDGVRVAVDSRSHTHAATDLPRRRRTRPGHRYTRNSASATPAEPCEAPRGPSNAGREHGHVDELAVLVSGSRRSHRAVPELIIGLTVRGAATLPDTSAADVRAHIAARGVHLHATGPGADRGVLPDVHTATAWAPRTRQFSFHSAAAQPGTMVAGALYAPPVPPRYASLASPHPAHRCAGHLAASQPSPRIDGVWRVPPIPGALATAVAEHRAKLERNAIEAAFTRLNQRPTYERRRARGIAANGILSVMEILRANTDTIRDWATANNRPASERPRTHLLRCPATRSAPRERSAGTETP